MNQPTPADFDTAYAEAVAYADPAVTHYDTFAFVSSLDTMDPLLVVVNSSRTLVTPQGNYIPVNATFTAPETNEGIVGVLEMQLDYLPPAAQTILEAASMAGAEITVYWRHYLGVNIDPNFEGRLPFAVTTIKNINGGATITATLPDLLNIPLGRRLMTTLELPGLAQ